jgi:2-polyprenyl-3-methyl-5-hydroxy-6-metoxy-1,4-benzoquinol methylase
LSKALLTFSILRKSSVQQEFHSLVKDDISDIKAMYERNPEREEERLLRHQLEHELTWRYFDRYLPDQGSVLEVGAASGRYTLDLARRGYTVTAVDLSETLTALGRRKTEEASLASKVYHLVGEARDLCVAEGEQYDAALVMGPLYHVFVESERRTVLRQVFDLLRPGSVIFTAFISRLGIWGDVMGRQPGLIRDQVVVRGLLENGHDPPDHIVGEFRGYFAAVEEIAPLHESAGFETLVVAGVEPAIGSDDGLYNALQGRERSLWLDHLYAISAKPSIVGASRHLLYIGRKPKQEKTVVATAEVQYAA